MIIERLDRAGWPVFNVDEAIRFFSDLLGIKFEILPAERLEVKHHDGQSAFSFTSHFSVSTFD